MSPLISNAINVLSYACLGIGIFFWIWGTSALLARRTVFYKLHSLSIADTLGSMAIVVGLLLKIPNQWMLLLLALIFLIIWNTMLGYVLAYCNTPSAPTLTPPSEQA
jgi:multicomponent Na+:H+ antiporter subunit G